MEINKNYFDLFIVIVCDMLRLMRYLYGSNKIIEFFGKGIDIQLNFLYKEKIILFECPIIFNFF